MKTIKLIAGSISKGLRILKILCKQNLKTIFFNFKYLPFKQAIMIPIKVSNNVYLLKIGGQLILDCPIQSEMIRIGYGDVGIFDKKASRSIWEVYGTVIFKGHALIGHGSKLSIRGTLILGNGFHITAESAIVAFNRIEFGDNCLLSWDTLIMDTDFHTIKDKMDTIVNPSEPIVIGDKVWIGCRCLILKGAIIPNNCVIGANALVSKRLEKENAIYGGQPARIVKEDIVWTP
jgi:acetyltransferase-like isoleucine patch superfamily enzyme